ncbi:ABC transporter ATP-binding protein [Paenibacillus sp. GCM10027629]|uniref:ABC transporter ATP-binding protein n=1 Tax=Paenibacillus sp. GCM10027629 TaxID=3273414 RepID=UPI00364369E8
MSNDNIVVQLEHVSKVIGGKTIINDLSFSVERGEVYGFLGPNGSGKTTTIRMMLGLISMTKGEIYIEGHSVRKERSKAVSYVGAIVENPELYKYMTGYKNLIHFARMSATPVSKERIQEIVKLVDLEKAIHQKVKTYSLGMRQRLGIAQALLHEPSILILDEPTNGLDPAGIHELRDYLRKLASEENIAVVVSSHLLSEIELMCDRVVIIQNGQYVDERTIKGVDLTHQKQPVAIEVDDRVLAKQLLEPYDIINIEQNIVVVNLEKGQIPDVIAQLAQHHVRIYQVATQKESLEDMFLSLTKGGER